MALAARFLAYQMADMTPKPDDWTGELPIAGNAVNPQLSAPRGVHGSVSSLAMDPILPRSGTEAAQAATGRRASSLKVTSPVDYEAMEDAAVMLRVKDGDDAAFDYLVTKYRRPMLAFLYRMAHNTAVAEELAQEVL